MDQTQNKQGLQNFQQEGVAFMKQKKTKSQLVIEVTNLIFSKYPVKWKAKELALASGAKQRTVERILREMTDAELLEKRDGLYTLNFKHINQFYGAKWYVRQEIDKEIMITKGDKNAKEKRNS